MFTKLTSKLEDENNPLLGPTIWGLRTWGMLQTNSFWNRFLYNALHFIATLFVISQYVELWFIRSDLFLALRNLSVTMLSSICVVKAWSFVFWHLRWKDIIAFISNVEKTQLSSKDDTTERILREYIKYSRKVSYFYWCLVAATVFTVIFAPLASFVSSIDKYVCEDCEFMPYPEIMSSWLPCDRTRGYGYWLSIVEHTLICFYGGGIVAIYDSNAIGIMTFFEGQLKLLSINCERLFEINDADKETGNEKIRSCHLHHVNLIKYAKIFNSLLSPVMFLYVIICSLMICASAIQMTSEGTSNMQRIWIAEYCVALISQLFLYCWHGNNVFYMSQHADKGVYRSCWRLQGVRMRRNVILLGGQLSKNIVFEAGPFVNLTLPTFIAVLKGSYSYYTLLNK